MAENRDGFEALVEVQRVIEWRDGCPWRTVSDGLDWVRVCEAKPGYSPSPGVIHRTPSPGAMRDAGIQVPVRRKENA